MEDDSDAFYYVLAVFFSISACFCVSSFLPWYGGGRKLRSSVSSLFDRPTLHYDLLPYQLGIISYDYAMFNTFFRFLERMNGHHGQHGRPHQNGRTRKPVCHSFFWTSHFWSWRHMPDFEGLSFVNGF
jgi:hypothetical protein